MIRNFIGRFVREEDGQDVIEYSLLGAFISVLSWTFMQTIGTDVSQMYSSINGVTTTAAAALPAGS
jgi:Flp pilus assembly pilin Flp